jgi:DNA-binding transcriptional MerR regulator
MNCMKDAQVTRTFTLDELCTLVDLPKRTVRYYIQLGLVDRPEGETRAARYGPRHVEQLLQIRKWTEAGVSLERIGELLSGEAPPVPPRPRAPGTVEVWSHLVIADGVELALEPTRAGLSPEGARALFNGVLALYQSIQRKEER